MRKGNGREKRGEKDGVDRRQNNKTRGKGHYRKKEERMRGGMCLPSLN